MSSRLSRTSGGLIRLVLFVAVLAILVVGASMIPGAIGNKVDDVFDRLNPFDEKVIDRTGPSVLNSLTELREFKAAGAYYETVVDLEKDSALPGFVRGERVLYVGKGEVEATVEFSELDERRVDLSEDGKSVTVTLPAPTVGEPELDLKSSYFALRDKGLINRFEGSDLEQNAQLKAMEKMTTAATDTNNLIDLAKDSTEKMLHGLFGSLGYTDVNIAFDE
jgi:hypothetical protein